MRSFLLFISFTFLFHLGYSQSDTTIYYKANNKSALGKNDASYFTKIKKKRKNVYKLSFFDKKEDKWTKLKYARVLTIKNDSTIKILDQFTRDESYKTFKALGDYYYIKEYNKNGKLIIEGLSKSYIYDHWEGQVKKYHTSGNLASISQYKNNQERGNKNWLDNGKPFFDNIFVKVDLMPEFPGGIKNITKYIARNVKYPEEAHNNSIQGRVFVNFVVDIDGKVIGTHIIRQVHPLLDKEAIRVVSEMPKWRAGKLDGKPVRVKYTLPINFRLR